jgi:hypothetical protein
VTKSNFTKENMGQKLEYSIKCFNVLVSCFRAVSSLLF